MVQIVSESRFQRAFDEAGRGDNFTPEARRALFEYLEAYEEETGETITVNAVELCSEFSEYETASEAAEEFGVDVEGLEEDHKIVAVLSRLTTVIRFPGGVIVQGF